MKTTLFIIFIFFATTCLSQNFRTCGDGSYRNRSVPKGTVPVGTSLCFSQNYYEYEQVIYDDDFTYICKHKKLHTFYIVKLHRLNSIYIDKEIVNKNGTTPSDEIIDGIFSLIHEDNWTRKMSYDIVNKHFLNCEVTIKKGNMIDITMYIDSETGKVSEVEFLFRSDSDFMKIPPKVFYEIEKELKEKIYFRPTGEGKKLNYLMLGWMHHM